MSKLDYYIHDEADALRLQRKGRRGDLTHIRNPAAPLVLRWVTGEIEGDLAGPGVASLEQAWKTAKSVLDGSKLVIDLVSASEADEYLKRLHRTATGRDRAGHRSSKGDTSV